MVKRFDVWVTRDHYGDNDRIEVSGAFSTTVTRHAGCCVFITMPQGRVEKICVEECLKRYGFLPRPGQCWNVWVDGRGNMHYQEYPILEEDDGTLYKKVSISGERKHYL